MILIRGRHRPAGRGTSRALRRLTAGPGTRRNRVWRRAAGHVVRTGTSDNKRFNHFRGERSPRFAHPSELELAHLLDASGIPWLYEPHTFVLEHDDHGNVVEAFTPDFYLPEAGMYVECTTVQPWLMARKRRKVRKAR